LFSTSADFTTQQVKKMGLDILCIREKQGDDTNRINEFADEISEIKEGIEEIKQYQLLVFNFR
jgi:peptidoglycan hydrolase CwlO-like protein